MNVQKVIRLSNVESVAQWKIRTARRNLYSILAFLMLVLGFLLFIPPIGTRESCLHPSSGSYHEAGYSSEEGPRLRHEGIFPTCSNTKIRDLTNIDKWKVSAIQSAVFAGLILDAWAFYLLNGAFAVVFRDTMGSERYETPGTLVKIKFGASCIVVAFAGYCFLTIYLRYVPNL